MVTDRASKLVLCLDLPNGFYFNTTWLLAAVATSEYFLLVHHLHQTAGTPVALFEPSWISSIPYTSLVSLY